MSVVHSRPNKGVDGENTQDQEPGYNFKQGCDGKLKTTYDLKAYLNVYKDAFTTSVA